MTLVVRAITANAQTSVGAHWSNGTGWVLGCTLAANGNNVTIDSAIPGGESTPITAGSFVTGVRYRITFSGTTTWTAIGAASNNVGVEFQATGAGSGTGTAVAISTITTAAAGAAAAGGGFTLSAGVQFSSHIVAGSTTCLAVSGSNNYTLPAIRVIGGASSGALGVNYTGSGVFLVSAASTITAGTGAAAHGIACNGTGTVRIDNALDVRGGSSSSNTFGIYLLAGTVDVQNNSVVTGGTSSGCSGISGAAGTTLNFNNSTSNSGTGASATGISTSGNITGTNNIINAGTNEGLVVSGSGVMTLTGTNQYNASSLNYAVTATSTTVTHTLSGVDNSRVSAGVSHSALNVRKFFRPSTGQQSITNAPDNTASNMYSSDSGALGQAPVSAVLAGTVYGPGGSLLGTLAQTVSPSLAQIATAVWTATDRTLSSSGVSAIQSGIRTELSVELAQIMNNLDATITSRLSSDSYTAPPATDAIVAAINTGLNRTGFSLSPSGVQAVQSGLSTLTAPDVWAHSARSLTDRTGFSLTSEEREAIGTAVQAGILNESDGQQILNAIVGAIGNQNIEQVALVAAIRADLERSGGVLATRLASQSYTAPDNTGITAIKVVTDLLSTSRLANVPTEDFLLQVISQWLSSPS